MNSICNAYKKRLLRFFLMPILCLAFIPFPVVAQVVMIDPAHILETIHNGYQTYQSVLNSIKQVEYAYVSTQAQLKQLQQLNMSDIRSFTDAVSFVDKQIDFVRKTENRFKNISVNVGGTNIPLTQFYRAPGAALDMIERDMTANMSASDKARAWSHYGLNPANYFYVQAWKGRLQEASKQMVVIKDVVEEENLKTAEQIDIIVSEAEKSESSLAVLQALTALTQILIGEQMEANRLNAMAMQNQADKDMAAEMPINPRSTFSKDWLE